MQFKNEKVLLKTKIGNFTGTSDEYETSCKFLGIRYANAKRFEKPTLVTSYGDYDATKFGACCPQQRTYFPENPESMYFKEFRENLTFTYSEDCLFLNIYSPKIEDDKKFPVLIYIHGGSYNRGSSSERPFDGTNLAKKGLMCVTLNYRTNIFGSYMGKNLMLHDMKAAIEWVYNNISEFGGDKDNITLSGQSAGAMSVQQLILNDEIKKYVKRAIMISGGGLLKGLYAPKKMGLTKRFYTCVDKILKEQNLDANTASTEQLFMAYYQAGKKEPVSSLFAVFPVIDEDIIKKSNINNAFKQKQLDCIMTITKDDLKPRFYLADSAKNYQKKAKKMGTKVYLNYFNHDLPGDENGAFHSSDLWYFFGNLDQHTWRKFTFHDAQISKDIMNITYQFCTLGTCKYDNYVIY